MYCFAYLFFLWQTSLGLEAVLDGAENILLSEQIYTGNLPSEPFYRPILYQCFLSFWRLFGLELYITSLIYGLYPPLIFYAAEPVDTTLAITFMLIFVVFFIKGFRGEKETNKELFGAKCKIFKIEQAQIF
ncbi:MAG: hypothetical protein ACOX2I_02265 [Candidatus Ozemobacteraceae bacterium]